MPWRFEPSPSDTGSNDSCDSERNGVAVSVRIRTGIRTRIRTGIRTGRRRVT